MRSFREAVCVDSLKLLVISSVLFLVIFAMVEFFLSKALFTGTLPTSILMISKFDDFVVAARTANRSRRLNVTTPKIYFFGSSAMREAVFSSSNIEAEIKKLGRNFTVVKLATSGQSLAETFRLADAVNLANSVAVIGVNPIRLHYSSKVLLDHAQVIRLVKRSEALSKLMNVAKKDFIWSLNLSKVLLQLKRVFTQNLNEIQSTGKWPHFVYQGHRYDGNPSQSDSEFAKNLKVLNSSFFPSFFENYGLNLALLENLIHHLKSKGVQPILLELPMNPWVRPHYADILKLYQPLMRSLATSNRIPYLEFIWQMGLKRNDFFDFSHLRKESRTQFQTVLIEQVFLHLETSLDRGHRVGVL